jgi:hypothetical protein
VLRKGKMWTDVGGPRIVSSCHRDTKGALGVSGETVTARTDPHVVISPCTTRGSGPLGRHGRHLWRCSELTLVNCSAPLDTHNNMRLITPIVVILSQVSPVAAQAIRVTGTSVALAPPAGFVPSSRPPRCLSSALLSLRLICPI